MRRPPDLPADVYRELLALPEQAERLGWAVIHPRPRLERHVRWLFLRLCPHDAGRPWGYARIARAEEVSEPRTVQCPVAALAELVGIDLPDLPPGRPAKVPGQL